MTDPTPNAATGVHQHQRSVEWYVIRWHGGGPTARITGTGNGLGLRLGAVAVPIARFALTPDDGRWCGRYGGGPVP